MTRRDVMEVAEENELLCPTGHENAIIGLVYTPREGVNLALSREKCIQNMVDRDGMSREDAEKFFDFNFEAYVGKEGPKYVELIDESENSDIPERTSEPVRKSAKIVSQTCARIKKLKAELEKRKSRLMEGMIQVSEVRRWILLHDEEHSRWMSKSFEEFLSILREEDDGGE